MHSNKHPSTNWNFFIFPVACIEVIIGSANDLIIEEHNIITKKTSVYAGTLPSHKFKINFALRN